MSIDTTLPWTYDLDEAMHIQENLSKRVRLTWDDRSVSLVAGIDFDYPGITVRAAISIFRFPDLSHVSTTIGQAPEGFPYMPGLLAFRVGPAILEAWERMKLTPDLIMIHGHGIAHPRGLGLASHVGLWLNLPTIGVAKTRLYGNYGEVGSRVGDYSEIRDEKHPKQLIGAALRTQPDARPIFVSPGHLIDLSHAIEFVLACCRTNRLPEPVRLALK